LFFRWGYTPSTASTRVLSKVYLQQMNTQTYTLGATTSFLSAISNEFRLGYARSSGVQIPTIDSFGGATPINMASVMGISSAPSPEADFALYVAGVGTAELDNSQSSSRDRQWNAVDTLSYAVGRHVFKFGADYRRIASPLIPQDPYVFAEFYSAKTTNANILDYLFLSRANGATPVFNETSVFAQDEWKLTSALSLSLGIRWECNPPVGEANDDLPYTVLGDVGNPTTLTLAPKNTPLWHTTWYNFAPRAGMAWQVHSIAGHETVLRTGAGVFFDTDNQQATQGFQGIGFRADKNIFNSASLPIASSQFNFAPNAIAPYTSAAVYAFPQHLQLPYTLEWNVSLDQAAGNSQLFTISYVGSNARRLVQMQSLSVSALNPNFNNIIYAPSGVTANYQALQLKFQRTVAHGLQALASYTWSHSLDYGSNNTALPLIRGVSDFDVRNSATGGTSWEIPHMAAHGWLETLIDNWGLDARLTARTGFPVTLQGNYLTNSATGSHYYGGVNLVANQPIYLYSSYYPGGRILNKAAFSLPTGTNSGAAPRNFVRGFGTAQINFAARREFPLRDHVALQFRAEAFNILNHPNFGYVDPSYTSATFGQATKMLNSSLGTVASQYQQGGARSMQFALKLVF
jgi:hypothetical protein